ncbi:MAG: creatininase family protein [Bacteroidota bacterium]
MKTLSTLLLSFFFIFTVTAQKNPKATIIENKLWTEARTLLHDTTIVVIPLGAASKEHGPHLHLKNDWLIAEYLKSRVAIDQPVVIYPTINYNYYPAFLEYAGSTSLRMETAYSLVVDICRVISAHGPKKFYILNTGVSTLAPLKIAKSILAQQGITMTYTDILNVAGEAEKKIKRQPAGTHADEIETSMMLYIAPETVHMSLAARDIPVNDGPGPLTLDPNNSQGRYSPTGIYGDATLATKAKGKIVIEAMVNGINKEINDLRKSPVPKSPEALTLSAMTGSFSITRDETIVITLENNILQFEGKGPRKYPLLPQTANSFTIGERGRIVYFQDEKGFSTIYLNWEGVDYSGRRIN